MLNVSQFLVTSQWYGRRVVCPCALCDEHHTAIPVVKQATYVIPSVHPLIVKQSLSRIFIKLRHFRHLFYILMFLKLQTPTLHDCEILTSHGGPLMIIMIIRQQDYLGMDVIHLPLVIAMPWDLLSHAVVLETQMRA